MLCCVVVMGGVLFKWMGLVCVLVLWFVKKVVGYNWLVLLCILVV